MMKSWTVGALALLGLVLGWQLGANKIPTEPKLAAESTQTLPDEVWQNLEGGETKLSDWQGQVLVINHWATWCEPCRTEIPMFMAIRQKHLAQGLEFIGIAHDDAEDVRHFVDSMGVDYPQLIADPKQGRKWLATLGSNGSLPLTLVYDRSGQLRAKKIGLMSEAELEQALAALL